MAIDRRSFLCCTGLSGLMLAGAPRIVLGNSPGSGRDTLVVIFLRGGLDGLSAVVPHADPAYYQRRATIAVPRPGEQNGALPLTDAFGLHPSLAPLKPHWDAGRLGFVHAVGLSTPSRSHFDAQDFMERAWMQQGGVFSGWLNRYLTATAAVEDGQFRAVAVGRAVPRSAAGPTPVVGIPSVSEFGLSTRSARRAELEQQLALVYTGSSSVEAIGTRTFDAIGELAAANLGTQTPENGASYPNTTFGNYLRTLASLIKSPLGVQTANVDIGGWDTHGNQNTALNNLFDELARALNAFVTDLGSTRMNRVSVMTLTEFGRRAYQNASGGTDHGRGTVMLALGGGVAGRQIVGDWPGLADAALEDGDLRVTTDYRAPLVEWLRKRGGADDAALAATFPGYSGASTQGLFLAA